MSEMSQAVPVLELQGIVKQYHGVRALNGINLQLQPGSIHALIGENGAGKSTLINIATGLLRPDQGQILIDGQPTHIHSPAEATAHGIHVVHQEAELFAQLSLAENMLLAEGLESRARFPFLIDWPATYATAQRTLAAMDARSPVRAAAGSLSIGRRVEASIAAAVSCAPRVLFLDEPTASLTHGETRKLIEQLLRLKRQGVAIVYVSHRLEEVLELSDTVTTLRDGCHIASEPAIGLKIDDLVARMVGREMQAYTRRPFNPPGEEILSLNNLTSPSGAFKNVSLKVRRGEIVGLYGLVGAGRTELARAIFGLDPYAGVIEIHGQRRELHRPIAAMQAGIAYLPEDRLNEGIFAMHSCSSNVTVAALRRMGDFGFLSARKEHAATRRQVTDLQVKLDNFRQPISTLSGGNQQKLVFGRWLETHPDLLILDEPTRGVDVGAKAQIHHLIGDWAAQGKAVLMISSELQEILQVSDRILVLAEGQLAGEFDAAQASEDAVVSAALPTSKKSQGAEVPTARSWFSALHFREFGIVLALILITLGMALARPAEFASLGNLLDVLTAASIVGIAAIGMTLVIITGGIDISVGSMLGLVGAAAGMAALRGLPPLLCLGLALCMGAALGAANSLLSTLGRIHPIIVTLAGISVYRGLMLQLTGGYEIYPLPPDYRALVDGQFWIFPKMLCWMVGVLALSWVLLGQTLLGRRMLAVGNSEKAARLIGLAPWRLRLAAFAIMGALIGLASVLWAGYYGKIQSNTGEGFELQVIAAAVVGGCSIAGGRGTVLGAFLGAVLIALIYNCLVILKISAYWQGLFVGGLILAAILVDMWLPRLLTWRRREVMQ